jgi:xanthosine utilization system XapX-like protein
LSSLSQKRSCCFVQAREWRQLFGLVSVLVKFQLSKPNDITFSYTDILYSLYSMAECILACIESLVELFNRFALIYVAVHGQSFLTAGKSVMELFQARGWTTIITDLMIETVLFMVSMGVGFLVGLLSVMVAAAFNMQTEGVLGIAFVLGMFVGYAMCAVMFSVVSSAVNTVLVCYAEAPNEFAANHPQLANQMRAAWRAAWPNEFGY